MHDVWLYEALKEMKKFQCDFGCYFLLFPAIARVFYVVLVRLH